MIAVFYHLGQFGDYWKDLYTEHMRRLEPVLKEATVFFLHIEGEEELPFAPANAIVVKNRDPERLGEEGDTLAAMHRFAKASPGWKILYTHSKGVTKVIENEVHKWTDYLFSEVVDKREHYLSQLKNYGVSGPVFHPAGAHIKSFISNTPQSCFFVEYKPHYSGNFWWTTSEHIAALDPEFLKDLDGKCLGTRRASEFWVCSKGTFDTDSGAPKVTLDCYTEKEWVKEEWTPEVWFIGKEPSPNSIQAVLKEDIITRWVIETEDPAKYEGLPVEICEDLNTLVKGKYKGVYFYCPGTEKFYLKVLDKKRLLLDLKWPNLHIRNGVFFYGSTEGNLNYSDGKLSIGPKNQGLYLVEDDSRLLLRGIQTWK